MNVGRSLRSIDRSSIARSFEGRFVARTQLVEAIESMKDFEQGDQPRRRHERVQ